MRTTSILFILSLMLSLCACNNKPDNPCDEILNYSKQVLKLTDEDSQISRGLCDICLPISCAEKCKISALDLKCRTCISNCTQKLSNFLDENYTFEEE